ncbi:MAG: prolyl oligopeptidase family serine peptidase [Clostridia bacterium]|nr:prolyl oligopeptidase family serine peptidase [Clostridia bacterium]
MKISLRAIIAAFLAAMMIFSFGCAATDGAGDDTQPTDTTAADTTAADTTAADTEPAETEPIKPDPPVGEHEKIIFTDSFQRLDFTASSGETLPYCLYVPENYSEDYAYPLFLFFQGSGTRGDNNGTQLSEGVQGLFVPKNTPIYDSIAVFPLCDLEGRWAETDWAAGSYSVDEVEISRNMFAVVELLDYLIETYSINTSRQYVTGFSMGGYGTWDIIARYPDRFAAAAPLCGAGDPSKAEALKDTPIWVFHDLDDDAVPVSGSQDMVNALQAAGSTVVKYTESQGMGHRIWDPTYRNPEFQTWMFSQVRK